MKKSVPPELEQYRITHGYGVYNTQASDGFNGAFRIKLSKNRIGCIICSDGDGWDHVSVHVEHIRRSENRIVGANPTWEEMCLIKDMFFDPTDWVMQLHPPPSKNINIHDHTLHLWRPHKKEIPLPPTYMV
jgi:hypothetical protein